MGVLLVREDTLEFGLERGHRNFSQGARALLERVGVEGAKGPCSLLSLKAALAVVSAVAGALLTFPGLRLAKMHADALSYAGPLTRTLLHLNMAAPLLVAGLWVRPVSRDRLVGRSLTGEAFEGLRVGAVLACCLLRLLLTHTHLQAHLNMACHKVLRLRREAGRISSLELQRLVVRVYYYLCVVALQYLAPLVLLAFSALLLSTLGGLSPGGQQQQQAPPGGPPVAPAAGPPDDPSGLAGSVAHFSLTLQALKEVFSAAWFRGVLSYWCWWLSLSWFITSAFGLLYHMYFTS